MDDRPSTREQALAWAARVRTARDGLIASVGAGDLTLPQAVERAAASDELAGIWAVRVIEALPGTGKVGCRRALSGQGIGEQVGLGTLSAEQVASLERVLA